MHFIYYNIFTFFPESLPQDKKDTLVLTLPQAEKNFLEKNLELIALEFDINKACVQQAKYRDNPALDNDQNIYGGQFLGDNSIRLIGRLSLIKKLTCQISIHAGYTPVVKHYSFYCLYN